MPYCPTCLKEARKGEKFCPHDKSWLYVNVCPKCFNESTGDENFCIKCGNDLAASGKKSQQCEFKWVGPGWRILAGVVDFLICFYVLMVIYDVLWEAMRFQGTPWVITLPIWAVFVLFYFSFFNSGNRQTIGKQAMNTVAVQKDLKKVPFTKSLFKVLLIGFTFLITFAVIFILIKPFIIIVFIGTKIDENICLAMTLLITFSITLAAYTALSFNFKAKCKQTWYDKLFNIIVVEFPG